MISKENFIQKVEKQLYQKSEPMKQEKIFLIFTGIWLLALFIFIGYGGLNFFTSHYNSCPMWGYILFTLCVLWPYAKRCDRFIDKQKKYITPILLSFLGDIKDSQDVIDKSFLRYTCLFPEFHSIRTKDAISGTIDNTEFSVLETEMHRFALHKRETMIFQGICIDIPMKKSIPGYILLFNTKFSPNINTLEKISLEDNIFANNYQIYSDNQIEARTLLTPAFMERLNNLKRRFKGTRVDVSFFGMHAVFAIHTSHDFFESYSLTNTHNAIKTYEKFYDDVNSIQQMIEILHINNKSLPSEVSSQESKCYEKIKYYQEPEIWDKMKYRDKRRFYEERELYSENNNEEQANAKKDKIIYVNNLYKKIAREKKVKFYWFQIFLIIIYILLHILK